ncbi:integrator complex subunit 5-like isoform X2 [Artemia franciscana]|uniref:integrator complex subunit 5-like isoform X2 n=1 Tax=Artemia franciscana TaxID=6661 RepID=UPI0032DB99EC
MINFELDCQKKSISQSFMSMDGSPMALDDLQSLINTLKANVHYTGSRALPREHFKLDVRSFNDIFQLMLKKPSCKSGVLVVFGVAYDHSVYQCVTNTEKKSDVTTQYTISDEVNDMLKSLLSNRAWTSVLLTWCIKVLGQLSSKYASFINSVDLEDIIKFWFVWPPTRHLIEMMSDCLENITQEEADSCIRALLEMLGDPHYDWVVAHMGKSFPEMIISRILFVGLHDSVTNRKETSGNPGKLAKVKSAILIVGHLCEYHLKEVENGISELYKLLPSGSSDMTEIQKGVLPFLLHMCTASLFMRDMIVKVLTSAVSFEVLEIVITNNSWIIEYYGSVDAFRIYLSKAILCLGESVEGLLHFIFSTEDTNCIVYIQEFVTDFVARTFQKLHGSRPSEDFPILSALLKPSCLDLIIPNLLSKRKWYKDTSVNLLVLLSTYRGSSVAVQALAYLLCHSEREEQLCLVYRLTNSLQPIHWGLITQSLKAALTMTLINPENSNMRLRLIENLTLLLSWENGNKRGKLSAINKVSKAVQMNIEMFLNLLSDRNISIQIVTIIAEAGMPELISDSIAMQIAESLLPIFFLSLNLRDPLQKKKAVSNIQAILTNVSSQSSVQSFILRMLIKTATDDKFGYLLGRSDESVFHQDNHVSLFEKNKKHSTLVSESHRYNASGVIGKGPRMTVKRFGDIRREDVAQNLDIFIETLTKCCVSDSETTDGITRVAMILLEILSPDVMYNGLPWPEEEFLKVTIERDLYIKKTLETQPVLWEILRVLAFNRPALCYCSVILRAPLGILMSQWSSEQQRPELLEMTSKILDLMSLGQLLPPPLTMISEILAKISPQEVAVLLRDVWSYMRENVPSPALFSKDSNGYFWRDFKDFHVETRYIERLRLIVLSNIDKLGYFYKRIFDVEEGDRKMIH